MITTETQNTLTLADCILYLSQEEKRKGEREMGTIRAKGKCPVCQKPFEHIHKLGLICREHKTIPKKFYIDLSWKGQRIRIFSDKQGQPLDSYQRVLILHSKIQHEIENHLFDPSKYVASDIKRFLFQNLIEKWLSAKGDLISIFKYQQVNKNFFSFFNNTDIRDIRTSNIHEFHQQLPDRLSEKTKKNIMDSLKAFMNWAYSLEYIEKVPLFPSIKIDIKVPNWIQEKEQGEILSALVPKDDRVIYLFLMLHGCRPSEGRALKVKDLNFEHGTIIFRRAFTGRIGNNLVEHTKTHRQRVIPINPEIENILKELCKDKLPEAFVFTDSKTGKPYSSRTLIKRWQAACKKAGKKIGLYEGSKHSFASQRVSKGVSIYLISKVLGHTDIKTTERYAYADIEGLRKAMTVSEK